MKKAALTHPKMLSIATGLGISRRDAIGLITLLLDFTATYATAGDIGKWPDTAIAGACEWNGDVDVLIDALAAAGWIDIDVTHRLIVHDWAEHCESWVKAKLAKENTPFVQPSREGNREGNREPTVLPTESGLNQASEPTSYLNLPSPTLPSPTIKSACEKKFDVWWDVVHVKKGRQDALNSYKRAIKRVKKDKPEDDPHDYLLDRMKLFASSPDANPSHRSPIHPATWLNQGRYDDDPATWESKPKSQNSQPADKPSPRMLTPFDDLPEEEREAARKKDYQKYLKKLEDKKERNGK